MKIKRAIVLAMLVALTTLQFQVSHACDCGTSTVKEAVDGATAVFTGKVIELDKAKFKAKFEVYRYWKGVTTKEVKVISMMGNCSYYFESGQEYLVYASGDKQLSTNVCTRTNKLAEAEKDLEELGKGTAPE